MTNKTDLIFEFQILNNHTTHIKMSTSTSSTSSSSSSSKSDSDFLFGLLNLNRTSQYQHSSYCDICSRSINGIRRTCLTCPDVDVCNDCYLRGLHMKQIKSGHDPVSCVFVEIHNGEQTSKFNKWMKEKLTPVVQLPPLPTIPENLPFHPRGPMMPIPTPRNPFNHRPYNPDQQFLDPPIFPAHPTFPQQFGSQSQDEIRERAWWDQI